MKQTMIVSFFLALCSNNAFTEEWDLDRTVKTAVEASSARAIEDLRAQSSRLDAGSAKASFYPKVSFDLNASYLSEVMEIQLPLSTVRFGDNESYEQHLAVNQLLYDGGRSSKLRKSALSQSSASVHSSEAAVLAAEFRARRAFFGVALAQNNISAFERIVEQARSHLRDVTALMNAGSALESDVLSAKLRLARSEMDVLNGRSRLAQALAEFKSVTGIPQDSDVTVVWEDSLPPYDAAEKTTVSRPELASLDARALAAENSAEAAKAGKYPYVALQGSWNYGRPGLNRPANEWMDWFAAGVFMNWNLWDWGEVSRNSQKAIIQREQVLKERENLAREFARMEQEAVSEYNLALERVQIAEIALEAAESRLERISAAYRLGGATETDYDTAVAALSSALAERSSAKAQAGIAAAGLDYALGRHYGGNK